MMSDVDKLDLKICNPTKVDLIFETTNYTSEAQGSLAYLVNPYFDWMKKSFNFDLKFIAYPGIGEKIDEYGHYSGCLGHLQSGEADFLMAAIDFPQPIENISQGYLLFDEKIGFDGVFKTPYETSTAQITSMFCAFDIKIWSLIIVTLIVFRVLLWLHLKVTEVAHEDFSSSNTRNSFYQLSTHFSGFGSIGEKGYFIKLIFLTLTIFSFFILTTFNGLINTDYVVRKRPMMFDSLDDLMKHNISPIFVNQSYEMFFFKNSPVGSKQRTFWDWAVDTFTEEKITVEVNIQSMAEKSIEISKFKSVPFSGENLMKMAHNSFCEFSGRNLKKIKKTFSASGIDLSYLADLEFQIYFRSEFQPKLKTLIFGKRILEKEKYRKIMHQVHSKIFEFGLAIHNEKYLANLIFIEFIMPVDEMAGHVSPNGRAIIENCKSGLVDYPTQVIQSVRLVAFSQLFVIFSLLIFFAILVYIFEQRSERQKRSKKHRRVHLNIPKKSNFHSFHMKKTINGSVLLRQSYFFE